MLICNCAALGKSPSLFTHHEVPFASLHGTFLLPLGVSQSRGDVGCMRGAAGVASVSSYAVNLLMLTSLALRRLSEDAADGPDSSRPPGSLMHCSQVTAGMSCGM